MNDWIMLECWHKAFFGSLNLNDKCCIMKVRLFVYESLSMRDVFFPRQMCSRVLFWRFAQFGTLCELVGPRSQIFSPSAHRVFSGCCAAVFFLQQNTPCSLGFSPLLPKGNGKLRKVNQLKRNSRFINQIISPSQDTDF